MDAKAIREAALAEIREEEFKRAVEVEKQRLTLRKPWWHILVPFRITVTWR